MNSNQMLGSIVQHISSQSYWDHTREVYPTLHTFIEAKTLVDMDLHLNIYAYRIHGN